jgi:hypothetical protein
MKPSLLLLSFALLSCSEDRPSPDEPDQPYGSCARIEAAGECREWLGSFFANADLRVSCDAIDGTYSDGACPQTSVLGVCTTQTSEATKVDFFLYEPFFDAQSAADECEAKDLAASGLGSTTSQWFPRGG